MLSSLVAFIGQLWLSQAVVLMSSLHVIDNPRRINLVLRSNLSTQSRMPTTLTTLGYRFSW